jgi:Tfp pilus assembly protein PilO
MLSKRERSIAILAGAVVLLLGLDTYVLSPLLASRDQLALQRETLRRELNEARHVMIRSRAANHRWKELRAAGLVADPSTTESGLLNAMRGWSQEAGLPLSSIRPDRVSASQGLNELTFQATANGSMQAIADFLYHVETAGGLPVRVHELQIASRAEGSDDLTLQLRISTLWEEAKAPLVVASRQDQERRP